MRVKGYQYNLLRGKLVKNKLTGLCWRINYKLADIFSDLLQSLKGGGVNLGGRTYSQAPEKPWHILEILFEKNSTKQSARPFSDWWSRQFTCKIYIQSCIMQEVITKAPEVHNVQRKNMYREKIYTLFA